MTRLESRRQPDLCVHPGVASCANVFSSIPHCLDAQTNSIRRNVSPSLSRSTIPVPTDESQVGGSPLNSIYQPSFSPNLLVPLCSQSLTGESQGGDLPLKSMTDTNISMGNIHQPSISPSLPVPSSLVESSVSDPHFSISSTEPAVVCNPERLNLCSHASTIQTQQFFSEFK